METIIDVSPNDNRRYRLVDMQLVRLTAVEFNIYCRFGNSGLLAYSRYTAYVLVPTTLADLDSWGAGGWIHVERGARA